MLIVSPTYNERAGISAFIEAVEEQRAVLPDLELLIVDDNSPDDTAGRVRELQRTRPWLHLLVRSGMPGLGAAYRDGFRWGAERQYAQIVQMDADLQHPPTLLAEFKRQLDDGSDLVLGTRYAQGGSTGDWGVSRVVLSRVGGMGARLVAGTGASDPSGGFRAWTRAALDRIDVGSTTSTGFAFQLETLYRAERAGLVITEAPYRFGVRTEGESKMHPRIALEGIRLAIRLRRDAILTR